MAKNYKALESSPFYYDQMMANASNTIRIYKKPKNSPNGTPIEVIRGIYKDDFSFGVQNQWQSGGGSILKMIVDSVGDMITGRDSKIYEAAASKTLDWIEEGNKGKTNWVSRNLPKVRDFVNTASDMSNSHFFSADDYFKSFKGSSVTVPTSLSFTLLSDSSGYDVYEDISALLDISIGEFSNIEGFIGMQAPPNGFQSNFITLDKHTYIEGSVQIHFGNPERNKGFKLENMVVSNVGFSFSKSKVLITKGGRSVYRPLMVDIQMSIEPARMFSREDLKSMLKL